MSLTQMLSEKRLPSRLLEYEDMKFCEGLPEVKPEPIPPTMPLLMVIGVLFSASHCLCAAFCLYACFCALFCVRLCLCWPPHGHLLALCFVLRFSFCVGLLTVIGVHLAPRLFLCASFSDLLSGSFLLRASCSVLRSATLFLSPCLCASFCTSLCLRLSCHRHRWAFLCEPLRDLCSALTKPWAHAGTQKTGSSWVYHALMRNPAFLVPLRRPGCAAYPA